MSDAPAGGASPLAALVGRALGAVVEDVRETALPAAPGSERTRITYLRSGEAGSVLLERRSADHARELALLALLAARTELVPAVHAHGAPRVPNARPWLLCEDTTALPQACDGDPRSIVDAKAAVERAVGGDDAALRALGLPLRMPEDIVDEVALVAGEEALGEGRKAAAWLTRWPVVLCHGDLRCACARVAPRGVVLEGWGRAHLGVGLLDAVRLAADLTERGDAVLGAELPRRYAAAVGLPLASAQLRAAELVDRLARRHLRAY